MARDNSPQERQQKQLARKQGRRASYDRILIVSEGSKTEPNYFREIRAAYRLHTANVEVRPSELGTAPIQVVQPNYTFRMQRLQAFKFELMPDGRQERQMRRFARSCRFVFNQALALQQANRQDGGKFIGYVAMAKYLTAWRNSSATAWLADAPVHPQQQALKDLERAYQNFFAKRSKFPRFKRHGDRASFRYPDPKQIKFDAANARIFLPKLGWLRLRLSRSVLGEIKSVTVSGSCGRWHASILTQREVEQPVPQGTAAVGIDMGVARFATMSDGTFIAPLASFKRHEARLRRYQRAMSRKRKGAKNWHKARGKVQRLHARIANVRQDFLHKASSAIAQVHALVVVEDLQVRSMSASAKGTAQQPGKNVLAKASLNKAILDQGWAEFRRQPEYKLVWGGGELIAVDPRNTSRTYPECGHVDAQNRQTQAVFRCVACGHQAHADVVGAINILARGHRAAACGEVVSRAGPETARSKAKRAASAKQEPTEATTAGSACCGAVGIPRL